MLFHQNAWVYNGGDCIWAALVNRLVGGVEGTYGKKKFRAHLSGVDLWWQTWRSWLTKLVGCVFIIAMIVLVTLLAVGTLAVPTQEQAEDWWAAFAAGAASVGAVAWNYTKVQTVWKSLEIPVGKQFFSAGDDPHFTAELGMMGRVK